MATKIEIENWLIEHLARALELEITQIDVDNPLDNYGLNSLTILEITGDLEEWLGKTVIVTIFYDYPTLASLAKYLSKI